MKIIAIKNDSYLADLNFQEVGLITDIKKNIDKETFKQDEEINIIDYLSKAKEIINNQNKIAELKAGLENVMAGLGKIK
jgi:hypothetical protein